jgi:hypothetical protein
MLLCVRRIVVTTDSLVCASAEFPKSCQKYWGLDREDQIAGLVAQGSFDLYLLLSLFILTPEECHGMLRSCRE